MSTKNCIKETLDRFPHIQLTQGQVRQIVGAVLYAYAKHVLDKEDIGWEELGTILLNAACEAIGDDGYDRWLTAMKDAP